MKAEKTIIGESKMLRMNVAIQCPDNRTKQTGTFGFRKKRYLYSTTPVFKDYVELKDYAVKNNIELTTSDK